MAFGDRGGYCIADLPEGRTMSKIWTKAGLITLAAWSASPGASFAQVPGVISNQALQVSVSSLAYDPAVAFFLGRGLPALLVERYATVCVVSISLRNQATDANLSIRLSDWRVRQAGGVLHPIRGRAAWLAEFDAQGISPPARMAFEWSQLPEVADMSAGDSIQGMLSVPIDRGSTFDLIVRWHSGQDEHQISLEQIRCA
jgi:hypothetical protein